jgi:hypothetical protein
MDDHISKPIDPAAMFETIGCYYRPTPGQKPESAVVQPSGSTEAILADMLRKNNPEAEAALEKVMQLCQGHWEESTRRVGEALDRFDFKGAIKALEDFAGDANVAIEYCESNIPKVKL